MDQWIKCVNITMVVTGIFAGGEVDEMNPRSGQLTSGFGHLLRGLTVSDGPRIIMAIETKAAAIAAMGADIQKPIEKYTIVEIAPALPPGRGEETFQQGRSRGVKQADHGRFG
jgi:hypothetical protein